MDTDSVGVDDAEADSVLVLEVVSDTEALKESLLVLVADFVSERRERLEVNVGVQLPEVDSDVVVEEDDEILGDGERVGDLLL